jgi:ferrochelatase
VTPSKSVGVLLVNLGSPEAPTAPALRRYLRQFLGDRRVVTLSPLLWQPLLNLVILPLRSPRSAELYRRVWTEEGAPLIAISRRQQGLLQQELGGGWRVALAMRYGRPSIDDGLDELQAAGIEHVVALTMFPQYAEATVGSVQAALEEAVARRSGLSADVVPPYYEDGVDRGDPYRTHCEATAEALASRLDLAGDSWSLVFQSRFGPQPWLQPYADQYVPALAERHPRVLVSTPGFPADCLETIDEIGEILAEQFLAVGGEELRRVPCLNEHPRWVQAMGALVRAARPAGV